ncbi:MAG: hypothetical protein SGILL_005614 [Bacillariaceae sp.]
MQLPYIITLALLLRQAHADLAERWKIDRRGSKIPQDGSASSFQLEYTVSDKVQFARYKIFQKGCKEEFGVSEGERTVQAPVKGSGEVAGDPEKKHRALQLTPDKDSSNDDQIASVTFTIAAPSEEAADSTPSYSISDLVSTVMSYFSDEITIEFCIRVGLWTPPEAGDMEVNFRETDVAVSIKSADKSVVKVDLEDCPMNEIDVRIFGQSASKIEKGDLPPPKYEVKKHENVQVEGTTPDAEEAKDEKTEQVNPPQTTNEL